MSDTGSHRRVAVERWSVRLVVAVLLVSLAGAGLRATGFFTPPVDTPSGVEATHAAFARTLAGLVPNSLDAAVPFPPPAPWYGNAPASPWTGFPVFGWLAAALAALSGAGEWTGRALSTVFSLLAGWFLFRSVRSLAGARAGLYALLFFSVSPLSIIAGQQYAPSALILLSQSAAVALFIAWRLASAGGNRSILRAAAAYVSAALCALIDPGSVLLLVPAAYAVLASTADELQQSEAPRSAVAKSMPRRGIGELWAASPHRGAFVAYAAVLLVSAALWKAATAGYAGGLVLQYGDGGGGAAAFFSPLMQTGTYVQIVGFTMERILTIGGALLLVAGLMRGARLPMPYLFHVFLLSGLLRVLADASRLARHDDVLLPLLLPLCALVGIGAAWAGSLPSRLWLALREQRHESEKDYHVTPSTSWLLDLPEEVSPRKRSTRPQAELALGKVVAQRTLTAGAHMKRVWALGVGNLAVLAAFAWILYGTWQSTQARIQPSVADIELKQSAEEIRSATADGSRLIVAGSNAPGIFYAAGRTGWALTSEDFSLPRIQELQREGASYLVSTDQDWLGRQADYVGLLTNFSVAKLAKGYILFDLSTKPAASDRLYFLESGHTLGGLFRRFWEANGSVKMLGYPISEELDEPNPLDGQTRRVQYFERAVLEMHTEKEGTPHEVMPAAVGLWVTKGRQFPRVRPFTSTPDRAYFEQTGHSVKQAFLRYWQQPGGLARFGYPISEELPEINPADGKVYTVQYFERARFEWHPTDSGTPSEVQLGLIGKQAWEMKK